MATTACNCSFCNGLAGSTGFFTDSPAASAEDTGGAPIFAPAYRTYAGAHGFLIKHQAVSVERSWAHDVTTTSMGIAWLTTAQAANLQTIAANLLASRTTAGGGRTLNG